MATVKINWQIKLLQKIVTIQSYHGMRTMYTGLTKLIPEATFLEKNDLMFMI